MKFLWSGLNSLVVGGCCSVLLVFLGVNLDKRPWWLSGLGFLIPIVAGGALAAYEPKIGMGAGGLTLAIAAVFKKDWRWWVVGSVILAVALFFYWDNQTSAELRSGQKE